MKKHILYLVGILFLATSCVSQRDKGSYLTNPDLRLEIGMQNLDYLGSVTVDVKYRSVLGSTKILQTNGESYNPRFVKETSIASLGSVGLSGQISKALYKIQDTYPQAEYILPIIYNKEVKYMLGGRYVYETMTLKVYKLK